MSAAHAERRPLVTGTALTTTAKMSGLIVPLGALTGLRKRRALAAKQAAFLERLARAEGALTALEASLSAMREVLR